MDSEDDREDDRRISSAREGKGVSTANEDGQNGDCQDEGDEEDWDDVDFDDQEFPGHDDNDRPAQKKRKNVDSQ
jgi:hypothetical protein